MRKSMFGLAALVVPAIIGGSIVTACGEDNPITGASEDICGPCGLVAYGDVGISGNAKLDGFFKAVADLNQAVVTINGGFETDLAALEAAFGLEGTGEIGARVDALVAKVKAEITANASGGILVNYAPPQCQANVSVAVEAHWQGTKGAYSCSSKNR